jgi:hypothetical protein
MTTDDKKVARAIRVIQPIIAHKRRLPPVRTGIFHLTDPATDTSYMELWANQNERLYYGDPLPSWEDRASRDDENVDLDYPPLF